MPIPSPMGAGPSTCTQPMECIFERAGSHHLYLAAPYTIPLRSTYSANIRNCFTVGRILSASHVAFGSTRVMGTCSVIGPLGAATAAVLCHERGCDPTDLQHQDGAFAEIQRRLLRMGQHIPGVVLTEDNDLAREATISASSSLALQSLPDNGPRWPLKRAFAQVLPGLPGPIHSFSCVVDVPKRRRCALNCAVVTIAPMNTRRTACSRTGASTCKLAIIKPSAPLLLRCTSKTSAISFGVSSPQLATLAMTRVNQCRYTPQNSLPPDL